MNNINFFALLNSMETPEVQSSEKSTGTSFSKNLSEAIERLCNINLNNGQEKNTTLNEKKIHGKEVIFSHSAKTRLENIDNEISVLKDELTDLEIIISLIEAGIGNGDDLKRIEKGQPVIDEIENEVSKLGGNFYPHTATYNNEYKINTAVDEYSFNQKSDDDIQKPSMQMQAEAFLQTKEGNIPVPTSETYFNHFEETLRMARALLDEISKEHEAVFQHLQTAENQSEYAEETGVNSAATDKLVQVVNNRQFNRDNLGTTENSTETGTVLQTEKAEIESEEHPDSRLKKETYVFDNNELNNDNLNNINFNVHNFNTHKPGTNELNENINKSETAQASAINSQTATDGYSDATITSRHEQALPAQNGSHNENTQSHIKQQEDDETSELTQNEGYSGSDMAENANVEHNSFKHSNKNRKESHTDNEDKNSVKNKNSENDLTNNSLLTEADIEISFQNFAQNKDAAAAQTDGSDTEDSIFKDIKPDNNENIAKQVYTENTDSSQTQVADEPVYLSRKESVLQMARLIKQAGQNNITKLTLRLMPEHLGKMVVEITESAGKINAKIMLENESAKNMFATNTEVIKQALIEKGINIESMDLQTKDEHADKQQRDSGKEQKNSKNDNRNSRQDNKKSSTVIYA